jgi:uncharacterized membrane protein YkvA (DUF1232 family)
MLKKLKEEFALLCLACKDKRIPLMAKILAGFVVAYTLSPIDLIPDFIPILGQLDDLIIVPLGIYIVLKMIPEDLKSELREKIKSEEEKKTN